MTKEAFLRFSGAVEWQQDIDIWFDERPRELGTMAREWFEEMRDCGNDVRELMHDGAAVACVADAPFGYVGVFKAHINVGFFHGASLRDPEGLLEGSGRFMRHVKLKPGIPVDAPALRRLIKVAYRDIKVRLAEG